jgi:hypothetical protein
MLRMGITRGIFYRTSCVDTYIVMWEGFHLNERRCAISVDCIALWLSHHNVTKAIALN